MSDEEAVSAKAKAVRNEAAKLTATYINGLAIGLFVVGCVAPPLSYIFSPTPNRPTEPAVVAAVIICFGLSISLHLVTKRQLKVIEP